MNPLALTRRIVLGIQYDGGSWHGWQTQPDGHTVQDRLQAALKKFTQQDLVVICAGRTDSGVHAIEQVVHFDTAVERTPISWVRGLNACLPPSIAVRWAHVLSAPQSSAQSLADVQLDSAAEVDEADVADEAFAHSDRVGAGNSGAGATSPATAGPSQAGSTNDDFFHARFSATARQYRYLLYNHSVRSPLLAGRAGWAFRALDVEAMQQGANHLLGTHDFSAFRAVECQAKSPVRSMHRLTVERRGDMVVFDLAANAFLHHMVRNIVGSLIYVGHGAHDASWMVDLLMSRNRALAAPTFMPDGLYLAKVDYDDKWGLPQQHWPEAAI